MTEFQRSLQLLAAWTFVAITLLTCVPRAVAVQQDAVSVPVRFVVKLADGAATDQPLYVAGNHPDLGNWRPDGLALQPDENGIYAADIRMPAGTQLSFKITRGTWRTVEKDAHGRELPNRTAVVKWLEGHEPFLISSTVETWSDRVPAQTSVTGKLVLHREFGSKYFERTRTIAVWLPPNYDTSLERFPVFYMHDGQNLFDRGTSAFGIEWQADEAATRLIAEGRLQPLMIVGIWNTPDRIDEYTPTADSTFRRGGKADDYLKHIVEEIKPFIDQNYHTRSDAESTAIGGSSLGGLFSLYAGQVAPETFGSIAALSPTLGWDNEQLLKSHEEGAVTFSSRKIYIDMGTLEGQSEAVQSANVKRVQRLDLVLNRSGWRQGHDYIANIIDQGRHNESAWSQRFEDVLLFLFPKNRDD